MRSASTPPRLNRQDRARKGWTRRRVPPEHGPEDEGLDPGLTPCVHGGAGSCRQTATLGRHQALHLAQVGLVEPQGRLDPDFRHVLELFERERIDAAANLADAAVRAMTPGVARDVMADDVFALAVFGDHVDEAHFMKLVRAVNAAAQDQAFGPCRVELARQQTVGPHSGKQVEQDLGKTQFRTLLRDDDIAGQHGFETAAESVPLDERDRHDREIERSGVVIDDLDAGTCILGQCVAISGPDTVGEESQVASHIEDTGKTRADDKMADGSIRLCSCVRKHALDRALHVREIAQNAVGETRHPVRSQEAPEGLFFSVNRDVDFVVLLEGKLRVGAGLDGRRTLPAPGRLDLAGGQNAGYDASTRRGCGPSYGGSSTEFGYWLLLA